MAEPATDSAVLFERLPSVFVSDGGDGSSADEPNQTFQLLLVAQLNLRRRSPSKPVEGGLASAHLWPPTLNNKKKVVE